MVKLFIIITVLVTSLAVLSRGGGYPYPVWGVYLLSLLGTQAGTWDRTLNRPGTRDWGTPLWKGHETSGWKGTWDQRPGYLASPVNRQTTENITFPSYSDGNKDK